MPLCHPMLDSLRRIDHPGLILFTTGTTGKQKAILHDFLPFIRRYDTSRPPLKALRLLLFDHIGGLNTLLHILFNQGHVISIFDRSVNALIDAINEYSVELLSATLGFLRLLSLYPDIKNKISKTVKIISYGTELVDKPTLDRLCNQFHI